MLPFLLLPPCRSAWLLSWLLSLGLLSFWSSLSTRWMMHSRDLSTFSQTFSWKVKDTRQCAQFVQSHVRQAKRASREFTAEKRIEPGGREDAEAMRWITSVCKSGSTPSFCLTKIYVIRALTPLRNYKLLSQAAWRYRGKTLMVWTNFVIFKAISTPSVFSIKIQNLN